MLFQIIFKKNSALQTPIDQDNGDSSKTKDI